MKLQLNQNLSTPKGKLLKGAIVDVLCDENSIPLDVFWRRRLEDSKIDNCVEILKTVSQSKSKK